MNTVLVTGDSGFLAGWTIRYLLEKGYSVRTTVRSDKKISAVTSMFEAEGVDTKNLSFSLADLSDING